MPRLYPMPAGGCAPPVMVARDDERCAFLLAYYRSEQMSERQWQEHLATEPGLSEFVQEMSQ